MSVALIDKMYYNFKMSTKIFNGYCLPKMTLEELLVFCKSAQVKLGNKKKELLLELYLNSVISGLDAHAIGMGEKQTVNSATDGFYKRVLNIKRTNYSDPIIDLESNAVFFPLADKILVVFYAQRKEMTEVWKNLPGMEEYGYWDSSDQPEEVSDLDWEKRGKEWNLAFPDSNSVPSKHGFVFDFSDIEIFIFYPDLVDHIINQQPSLETRTKNTIEVLMLRHFYQQRDQIKKEQKDLPSELKDFDAYLKSGEGQLKEKELMEKVMLLPKAYKRSDIA